MAICTYCQRSCKTHPSKMRLSPPEGLSCLGPAKRRGFRVCGKSTFAKTVPKGRLKVAQDVSPGRPHLILQSDEFVNPGSPKPKPRPAPSATRESWRLLPHLPITDEAFRPIFIGYSPARQSHLACPIHAAERAGTR